MGDNIKIIEDWENSISLFPKLNLDDARTLYQKAKIETDNKKIEILKREVIQGTLYVVLNFIKNNGLTNLNSSSYDMNDIISTCNEIWIKKINTDSFLKIKKFNEMFDGEFFNLLNDGLGITKYSIAENTILTVDTFVELLIEYAKQKRFNPNITYNQFLKYMESISRYHYLLYKIEHYGYRDNIFILFDAIINSFEEDLSDISKTKLEKIKYILISNGLEYLRQDINEITSDDTCELWIEQFCRNKIIDILLSCESLNDSQKDIIIKRFGLLGERCHSLEEVAKMHGVTRERIRQKEAKALRILRNPTYAKQFKDLM